MEAKLARSPFHNPLRLAGAFALAIACAATARAQAAVTASPQPEVTIVMAPVVAPAVARVRSRRSETGVIYPYGLSGTSFNGTSLVASQDTKTVTITAS